MKAYRIQPISLILALLAMAATANSEIVSHAQVSSPAATGHARIALSRAIPRLDGSHLKVSVVEVNYAPGEFSPPHSHPCPVVGYIVEGAIRMHVKGEPEKIYTAGDSFYEAPNGVHLVSGNASDKESAKLIAYFACDHETPLSLVVPESHSSGGK